VYILTDQLEATEDAPAAFERYQQYLETVKENFPPGAFELASSEWYHRFSDHRCPHDAWLEELRVTESGIGPRQATRTVAISVRLLGAYHDGHIEFRYHGVTSYDCTFSRPTPGTPGGHADWRYDEFRLSERGTLLHEIEWWHMQETARWLIEAADVEFVWHPFEIATSAPNER